MTSTDRSPTLARERFIAVAAIVLAICGLFGPAVVSNVSFALRDAAHFYYPLFQWTTDEWAAGRVPLWNPADGGGMPVVADATSSVFYPGKLLFALPGSFAFHFKLYVVAHAVLAAVGTYRLARHWGNSLQAGAVAAIGFACGGSVAFQHCNVVFLVGAAWLPWAWQAVDDLLLAPTKRLASAVWLAVVLALMIHGGDPQMAMHVAIGAAVYLACVWMTSRGSTSDVLTPSPESFERSNVFACLGYLAMAGGVAFALAAVQILPSFEASHESTRSAYAAPRTIYEAAREMASGDERTSFERATAGILGQPANYTHHRDVYDFSIGPWRLVELAWPNFFGRMFPTHRRWVNELPAEGRVWTPTLYLGLLVAVFGLWQWRLRSDDPRVRWLSWMFLLFTLGSFGWYGLGWAVRECYGTLLGGDTGKLGIGHPVGGVYWLLVTFLPGYVQFRYPAKLFVVAALALALLAARGWDEAFRQPTRGLKRALLAIAGLSVVGLAASFLFEGLFLARVWQPDPVYGPFDGAGALFDIRAAFVQAAFVSAGTWITLRQASQGNRTFWSNALLLVTVVDIVIANHWFVATAPTEAWTSSSAAAEAIQVHRQSAERPQHDHAVSRVYRSRSPAIWPKEFVETQAPADRMEQIVGWEHATLYPKHNLLTSMTLVDSPSSIRSRDRDAFWRVAIRHSQSRDGLPHLAALQLVGTDYVLTTKRPPRDREFLTPIELGEELAGSVTLGQMADPLPMAWVVHQARVLPTLEASHDLTALDKRTREVLFPPSRAQDFRTTAVVETDSPLPLSEAEDVASNAEACHVLEHSPQTLRVQVSLDKPGLLVVQIPFTAGWVAERRSEGEVLSLPILRTNRILQGVLLPAGEHTVEFRYAPRSFYLGAGLSSVAWVVLMGGVIYGLLRRTRARQKTS